MLKYVTDTEYSKISGSKGIPENFQKLVIEASSYINVHTFGRIDTSDIDEQVKYATCDIIDLIYKAEKLKEDSQNLKSENIEGWSKVYSTPEEIDVKLEKDKENILKTYLSDVNGNNLLYRGV